MADLSPLSDEHAEMLATKWLSGTEFRRRGVPFREGAFSSTESGHIDGAICDYREAHKLGEEEAKDLIFGETRADGFWEHIARAVPGRRVRSVYDHVRAANHVCRDQGKWTEVDLSRLKTFHDEGLDWASIGDALHRSADACRHKFQKQLAHQDTWGLGEWSPDEAFRLVRVMQDLNEQGKKPRTTPKFWEKVSELMGNTRSPNQCATKWNESLSPRVQDVGRAPRWRHADSKLLIQRVASLDLDSEDAIQWDKLIDERWNKWTTQKLQDKWTALKNKVIATSATHRDVVQQLTTQFSNPRASKPVS